MLPGSSWAWEPPLTVCTFVNLTTVTKITSGCTRPPTPDRALMDSQDRRAAPRPAAALKEFLRLTVRRCSRCTWCFQPPHAASPFALDHGSNAPPVNQLLNGKTKENGRDLGALPFSHDAFCRRRSARRRRIYRSGSICVGFAASPSAGSRLATSAQA